MTTSTDGDEMVFE